MHQYDKCIVLFRKNPKIILNFFYSIFLCIKYFGVRFYKLKLIVDFGSKISTYGRSKILIDKRLYLGGKYIAELSISPSFISLSRNSLLHIKGRVKLGPGVSLVVEPDAQLSIGNNTYITATSKIYCSQNISIGDDCAISWNTSIIDTDFHKIKYTDKSENQESSPISIGNKVWIGCNCTILKGVTIGNNCVIAANTLVNCSIPSNCLVAGNPMRIVKEDIQWEA